MVSPGWTHRNKFYPIAILMSWLLSCYFSLSIRWNNSTTLIRLSSGVYRLSSGPHKRLFNFICWNESSISIFVTTSISHRGFDACNNGKNVYELAHQRKYYQKKETFELHRSASAYLLPRELFYLSIELVFVSLGTSSRILLRQQNF